MISVCHIITGLGSGGAERMLLRLLATMDRGVFRNHVISLGGAGVVGPAIQALDIPLDTLDLRGPREFLTGLGRLSRQVHRMRPHVVQTWMYHANLLGGLAAWPVDRVPVVWNLRRGRLDRRTDKRTTLWTSRVCAALSSGLPRRIVCCSESSRRHHATHGYSRSRMLVIPNGFDLERFRPDPEERRMVRQELGAGPETILIGHVARFDFTKDHENLIRAAAMVLERHPQARFVLCGTGVDAQNAELVRWIDEAGIGDRVELLGLREDVPRLLAALDMAVSSSRIESFPNAVGEAMACGVPCVVTDAGDSSYMLGSTGTVVPACDAHALAQGIGKLCQASPEERSRLGGEARERVRQHFSLDVTTRCYERLYQELTT